MRVAFDCHVPFFLAHGGVQIQAEQTLAGLRRRGIEVFPLPWWEDQCRPEVIHFLGRPSLAYANLVRQKKIRLVVADLLTSQGSRTFWQRLPLQVVSMADRFCGGKIRRRLGWTVYDQADCCICLTPWEASLVRNMYGAHHARIEVVPNGVEEVFLQGPNSPTREDHLVTTLTITQRKRVLELVEAAALAQVKVRIIGKPYQDSDPYYLRFLESVQKARPWVQYVGSIEERGKVAQEYQKASGFVLLSAMESQSLSALEAAACGCPLLLSDLPWARTTFGEHASYCPVTAAGKTAPYLQHFQKNISRMPRFPHVPSWDQVCGRLVDLYRSILP